MADTYYYDIKLLLPCDGVNNATSVTDYSVAPVAFSFTGAAKVTTADSKYGGSCLHFPSTGSYVSTARGDIGAFGTSDFTVECWFKTTANNVVVLDNGPLSTQWQVFVTSTGKLQWYKGGPSITGTTTVNDGAWHHAAIARSSGTTRVFVDGVLDASASDAATYGTNTSAIGFAIGAQAVSRYTPNDYVGYIDDVRITRNFARYTANFTPPGANDTSTLSVTGKYSSPGVRIAGFVPPAISYKFAGTSTKLYDAIHGGNGRISGTVKIKGTPNYAVHRKVRLFRELDGMLIREIWSDPTTGAYSFDYVSTAYRYTVVSYDYQHNFRAIVADNLTPEVIT